MERVGDWGISNKESGSKGEVLRNLGRNAPPSLGDKGKDEAVTSFLISFFLLSLIYCRRRYYGVAEKMSTMLY